MVQVYAPHVAAYWDIPPNSAVAPLNRGGYNNHLFDVQGGDRHYVLRIYGNHSKPNLIAHELGVLWQVGQSALPFVVPVPVLTKTGQMCALMNLQGQRALAVLLPFIEGENPETRDLAQTEAVGEALAQLLIALMPIQPGEAHTSAGYGDLSKLHPLVPDPWEAANCLPATVPKSKKHRLNAILDLLHERRAHIGRLPQQLTHGDVIPGNILADGAKVTGIIDFEFCTMNPRAVDLACAVDSWTYGALNSGREWPVIAALCRGYARYGSLNADEIECIPALLLLRNCVVLLHIIGQFVGGKSPLVDVDLWFESLLNMDAWLTMNDRRLTATIGEAFARG